MTTTQLTTPQDLDAEKAVLGAVLIAAGCLRGLIVEEGLKPDHFYRDRHRAIWRAMVELSDEEEYVDVLTISARLKVHGTFEEAGGRGGLDELHGGVPNLGAVRDYAELVKDRWRWRQRLTSTYEQQAAVTVSDEAAFELALAQASELVALAKDESFVDPADLASHMWQLLESEPDEGLPWPVELSACGRMVRLRLGHVTVIGGWSHHGKSIVAQMMASRAGACGHRAVIWTNEDTAEEITARHLQRVTGVPAVAIADRKLTRDQLRKVTAELGRLPFGVQPCFGWDARQIARHIRQVRPALAVVDHFHVLPDVGKTEGADHAIQTLVAAAGQTPCHIVVVVQLNLSRNQLVVRPPPVARDIRGTGLIYALAHNVVLVHRQEEELTDDHGRPLGRPIQLQEGHIDVVKNKPTGKLGAVAVDFDAHHVRYIERAGA